MNRAHDPDIQQLKRIRKLVKDMFAIHEEVQRRANGLPPGPRFQTREQKLAALRAEVEANSELLRKEMEPCEAYLMSLR